MTKIQKKPFLMNEFTRNEDFSKFAESWTLIFTTEIELSFLKSLRQCVEEKE